MRLSSITLGVIGALAPLIPLVASHETHLAYLPTSASNEEPSSYLSVKWSILHNSLFANGNQVFPPPTAMRLNVPRYDGSHKTPVDLVPLSYSLNARPLSIREAASSDDVVRVSVDLLNEYGDFVTPSTVLIDLLHLPEGDPRIIRIRIQSNEVMERSASGSASTVSSFAPSSDDELRTIKADSEALPSGDISGSSKDAGSHTGYIFSPYWSPPTWSPDRRPHPYRHPKGHPPSALGRLVRPVVLPALLGTAAGLVACLVGFCFGHLAMSLALRCKNARRCQYDRIPSTDEEYGELSEKEPLVTSGTVLVTISEEEEEEGSNPP
ncbi:hypothetical protein N7468_009742 [Penicillium chermesinum]|uniref:Uncharacterized protein n=1 Tax=Penicillium chermesinum TaxID=63820 RepID=A0A9W9NKZ5_9EURO|nr:uncharacterized protein N7468_009742 [Penicillium chermesinum]KAJ5220538.1 hypothetical protein N7468_009742 [Penicillium chermesinum]KAJ6157965.1 hypothetical protein N7470_005557 [Penicillium chermesinum]